MSISMNIGITAANGKKSTKAITDISPFASNSDMKAFALAINDITTNDITSINKITKEDIDFTYTPLTFTVDSDPSNSSIIPTKIDDSHYSIAVADLKDTTKGVWLYRDQGGEGNDLYWSIARINITPNIDAFPDSYIVIEKSSSGYIWFASAPITSGIELSIFTDANSSNFVGFEFNLVIKAGQKDSTIWDSHTINFKIV